MFTTATIFAAWFSFGYAVTDIVLTRKTNKKLKKMFGAFQVGTK
jgi:hypothetical protein